MRRFLAVLLLMAMLCGCGAGVPESTSPETTAPETTVPETMIPPTTEAPDPVLLLLEGMTLRQKVGQLFLIRPEALTGGEPERTWVTEALTAALEQYPVGGFVLFAENIIDGAQLAVFNASIQEVCMIAPFLAVDEEGGLPDWPTTAPLTCPGTGAPPLWAAPGITGMPSGWVMPLAAICAGTVSIWISPLWRM